ncbi:MAG: hypothetical protein ACLUD2_05950 [Clostridium sp.]
MRGMYTDGILDVFLDQGLSFDGVIGCFGRGYPWFQFCVWAKRPEHSLL